MFNSSRIKWALNSLICILHVLKTTAQELCMEKLGSEIIWCNGDTNITVTVMFDTPFDIMR